MILALGKPVIFGAAVELTPGVADSGGVGLWVPDEGARLEGTPVLLCICGMDAPILAFDHGA